MEMELKGLIEKIKKDGVEEAQKKSQAIIDEAEKKAKEIIANAEEKAKSIIQNAEKDIDKLKRLAEDSIKQSVRDTILMLKQKIVAVFDSILKREISSEMEKDTLQNAIIKTIENFRKDEKFDIELLLGKEDKEKVEKALTSVLSSEFRKGITIKVSPNIETGFLIGKKGENYFYDFTDNAVAEAFRQYLNPRLLKILDADKK